MPRYIDADSIQYVESENGFLDDFAYRYDINEVPTADVVEVVRCKDCKYFEPDESTPFGICKCKNGVNYLAEITPNKEHFCSYGERKV